MQDFLWGIWEGIVRVPAYLLLFYLAYKIVQAYRVIKAKVIKKAAKRKYKKAIKALVKSIITSSSIKRVNVGIWDETKEIGEMEFRSKQGVSDELYVGQLIYLN